jgi:hypothetical protein
MGAVHSKGIIPRISWCAASLAPIVGITCKVTPIGRLQRLDKMGKLYYDNGYFESRNKQNPGNLQDLLEFM